MFRFALLCLLTGLSLESTGPAAAPGQRTNFVFFLVNDLGWADVGCFGNTFYETPKALAPR